MTTPKKKSQVTVVESKRAADTAAMITNGVDSYPEDFFLGTYASGGVNDAVSILEPTFKPGVLRALTFQNNILLQCIDAMEVNIDGTGYTLELIEGAKEDEEEKARLQSFFDEPYPNKSLISIRRDLRADIESTGNGYLEIIRNVMGDVTLMNYLPSDEMRLLRYDDPVQVTKTIMRAGKAVDVKVRARERRFVQNINGKMVYFKEFGASRELDRTTGKWAPGGSKLSIDLRASEVLHFTLSKEAKTPYGVPRWVNQLPSVLGSRKAEEFNLGFFDAGGLPPAMVLVQGGYLGDEVKQQIVEYLGGSKGPKHRAVVVEALSSSGSIDSSGSVRVTVERFGAERQQDSMFQKYDENTEAHVRAAFRLPPLFTGRAQDYNFATAMTGYMTAEAQVFAPERLEFDERMWWICKALGAKSYTFKSKPMTLANTDAQMKAIELVLTNKVSDGEKTVDALNVLTGLHLEYKEPPPEPTPVVPAPAATQLPSKAPAKTPAQDTTKPSSQEVAPSTDKAKPTIKAENAMRLMELADKWAEVIGLSGECNLSDHEVEVVKHDLLNLTPEEQKVFNEALAMKSLVGTSVDFSGLSDLCGHAATQWNG